MMGTVEAILKLAVMGRLPREHGGDASGVLQNYFCAGGCTTSCNFGFSRIAVNSSSL